MIRFKVLLSITMIIMCLMPSFGQKVVFVKDELSREPLVGALAGCGLVSYVSDSLGQIEFSDLQCEYVEVSYLGYDDKKIPSAEVQNLLVIYMTESRYDMGQVTLTASRYEQRLSENTVSIEILKPSIINNTNTIVIDEVLDKVPGVQMLDGQANIRGGSGYSYGAGSRVMLLLDGIPALQADSGFPNWGDMPVEAVGKLEILKGAGSALYGSAALNGIVNLQRTFATDEPVTELAMSYGQYFTPAREETRWWDSAPYEFNASVIHKQRFQHLDLILHGRINRLESYNADTYEHRNRVGGNLRYRLNNQWTIQLNTLFNFAEKSNFFLWKDSRKHAYEPSPGTVSYGKYVRYMIDPIVSYIPNDDTKHLVQSRIHYIDNQNNNDQANKSVASYIEYQFQKKINPLKLNVVLGTAYQNVNTTAELFDGETITSINTGIYGQVDKKFGNKLSLSAGLRYEYFKDKSPKEYLGVSIPDGRIEDGDLIMRFGANYKLAEYTSLRASYGQGYRFPTITERFISTTFSSFSILPNPLLNPEKGWTAEIGVKQGFKIFGMKGIADIAVFDSRYFDMIEFTFLQTDMFSFGFKPLNIGDTRIKGIDLGLGGQWEHKDWKTTIYGGITFINPTYTNFDSNPEIKNTLSTDENVLKYRSKQFYKFDLEISYLKFSLGGAIRYASNQINVDKAFETGGQLNSDIFEIKYWRSFHNMGYHLIDFRVSYELNRIAKLSLFLNNAFNEEYSLRPGLLEAPVNSSVRLDVKF